MIFLSTAVAALAALTAATPVAVAPIEARDEKPSPNEVSIVSASWAGSGCPPGSVSADLGEGATLLSLSFAKYIAQTGKNTQPADARKNCNVRVKLHYPQGWTYTVATTDYRGHATIPDHCSASLSANYFFSGQQETARARADFPGPQDKDYTVTTDVGATSLVWSKCGVTGGPLFNINSVAQINCHKDATIWLDTQDTKFNMKFHLQWKKCP